MSNLIDSLEYYHNRDEHGNLRTQGEPQPIDEPFDSLPDDSEFDDEDIDDDEDDEDDDDAIDRKYSEEA